MSFYTLCASPLCPLSLLSPLLHPIPFQTYAGYDIADVSAGRITELAFGPTGGRYVATWSGGGSLPGEMLGSEGLALDNQGNLYAAQNTFGFPLIRHFQLMQVSAPNATIAHLSANLGALQLGDVMTATGQAQVSEISRTIALYEWTITSTLLGQSKVFTSPSAQLVLSATRLFSGVQRISLRAQDSAGEWSARVQSTEVIYVSPVVPSACSQPRWVMMIYGAADNVNDGARLLEQIDEARVSLERNANPCVYVAMQLDGPTSIYSTTADTMRWYGRPGTSFISETLTEQAMDAPETLTGFVRWAQAKSLAPHSYLAIADHGQALIGTAFDNTTDQPTNPLGPNDGKHYLTNAEIASALTDPAIKTIDILHLDSCSMALMDVAYDLRNAAHYLVSSQYVGWGMFGYDRYANAINTASNTTGTITNTSVFAKAIVDQYANQAEEYGLPYTLSAVDLHRISPVKRAWDDLAVLLRAWVTATTSLTETQVRRATLRDLRDGHLPTRGVQLFNSNRDLVNTPADAYADAVDWALQIRTVFTDTEAYQDIRTAAQQIVDAVEGPTGAVVAMRAKSHDLLTTYCVTSDCAARVDHAHGLSVFYPPDAVAPQQAALAHRGKDALDDVTNDDISVATVFRDYTQGQSSDFTRATRWDEYLQTVLPNGVSGNLPVFAPLRPLRYQVYLPLLMR